MVANQYVLDVLLKDERLQKVRAQVEEAGCEILPDWAQGAVLLVPLTEKEAMDVGVELRAHHVVIAQTHQSHIESALAAIPKKRRPIARIADPGHVFTAAAKEKTATPATSQECCACTRVLCMHKK